MNNDAALIYTKNCTKYILKYFYSYNKYNINSFSDFKFKNILLNRMTESSPDGDYLIVGTFVVENGDYLFEVRINTHIDNLEETIKQLNNKFGQ